MKPSFLLFISKAYTTMHWHCFSAWVCQQQNFDKCMLFCSQKKVSMLTRIYTQRSYNMSKTAVIYWFDLFSLKVGFTASIFHNLCHHISFCGPRSCAEHQSNIFFLYKHWHFSAVLKAISHYSYHILFSRRQGGCECYRIFDIHLYIHNIISFTLQQYILVKG